MVDPDERVRLAAVRASQDAMDPGDKTTLFEVARQDPSSLVRVTAIRALAEVGDAQTTLELKDLWPTGDEPLRQAIVAAWSYPGMLETGGLRELLWAAESTQGLPAIIAGGILSRLGPETRLSGLAALAKAIDQGTAHNRAFAITMAPLSDPDMLKRVKEAAKSPEAEVKVAALSRLARHPGEEAEATKELGSMAAGTGPGAMKARVAMAYLGDKRVTALLERDGSSKNPEERFAAATALLALGDVSRAALFMADDDPAVRTRSACAVLNASDRW